MTTTRHSKFSAALRTTILMATLGGLLVAIGYAIGGIQIASVFLAIALLMNGIAYWFSDKIAIASARAKPLSEQEAPGIYQMVRELTTRADLPMPRLYMIPSDQPNAFATGRNPKHSAVAVTQGITKLLSEDELRGVISHELAHVKNRDILTQSVASAIGAMITYLAYFALWFGGDDDSPLGLIGSLALVLLAPIAATLIQLAVSRQREYAADATGAQVCGNPESLASALLRLEEGAKAMPMQVNQATEPLYIVKPFSSKGIAGLFSTHPPIEERVRRLRQMRPAIGYRALKDTKYSVVVVTWECAGHLRTLVATMNRFLDGSQELVVVDNASSERPRAEAEAWKGPGRLIELERNIGFGAASNVGVAEAAGRGDRAAQPRHGAARRRARPPRRRGARARGAGRPAGAQPRRHDSALGQRARGRRLAVGAGAGSGGGAARMRFGRGPSPTGSSAPLEVSWLTGACVAGPTALLRRLGPVRPGAAHVRRGRRPRPARGARPACARASTRPRAGSSTTGRARRRSSTARARGGGRPGR